MTFFDQIYGSRQELRGTSGSISSQIQGQSQQLPGTTPDLKAILYSQVPKPVTTDTSPKKKVRKKHETTHVMGTKY
ncbi:hypothetical protein Tco_1078161 [Tanacetum coccineum]